jgi:hypothetical protein
MKMRYENLAFAPLDDDYLFERDEEIRKRRRYNPAQDWDEDEAIERDYGDPLRRKRKSPYNWGEL